MVLIVFVGKRDGEEKRIEKIQRENGISENFEKGAFLVKRGERLFFCRGKKMMVLRRECCIEKGQRDFLVLDFGEEVFLDCARGLILKKRKHGKE